MAGFSLAPHDSDLERLKYSELQTLAKNRGVKANGKRGDLIDRLKQLQPRGPPAANTAESAAAAAAAAATTASGSAATNAATTASGSGSTTHTGTAAPTAAPTAPGRGSCGWCSAAWRLMVAILLACLPAMAILLYVRNPEKLAAACADPGAMLHIFCEIAADPFFIRTIQSLVYVGIYQLAVVVLGVLQGHLGWWKIALSENRSRGEADMYAALQHARIVDSLKRSVLFMMLGLLLADIFDDSLSSGRYHVGLIEAWNRIHLLLLGVPLVYIALVLFLEIADQMFHILQIFSGMDSIQARIFFLWSLVTMPLGAVYTLLQVVLPLAKSWEKTWLVEMKGSGPVVVMIITLYRLAVQLVVASTLKLGSQRRRQDWGRQMGSRRLRGGDCDPTGSSEVEGGDGGVAQDSTPPFWVRSLLVSSSSQDGGARAVLRNSCSRAAAWTLDAFAFLLMGGPLTLCIGGGVYHTVLVKIPFTYNFVVISTLFGVGVFNIMFHLLVSTAVAEPLFTTAAKLILFAAMGWNLIPIFSHLVSLSIDSWDLMPSTSHLALTMVERVFYWIKHGSAMPHNVERDMMSKWIGWRHLGYDLLQLYRKDGSLTTTASSKAGASKSPSLRREARIERARLIHAGMIRRIKNVGWAVMIVAIGLVGYEKVFRGFVLVDLTAGSFADENQLVLDHATGRAHICLSSDGANARLCEGLAREGTQTHDSLGYGVQNDAYAICDQRWHPHPNHKTNATSEAPSHAAPSDDIGLSSLDFALLANIAYVDCMDSTYKTKPSCERAKELLQRAFPAYLFGRVELVEDWVAPPSEHVLSEEPDVAEKLLWMLRPRNDTTTDRSRAGGGALPICYTRQNPSCRRCGGGAQVRRFEKFHRIDFHDARISVIAIQGTDAFNGMDVIADVRLWSEPVLFSVASAFLPTLRLMSHGAVARIIRQLNVLQRFFVFENWDLDYYENVVRYVHCVRDNLARDRPGWKVVVTGHSLGGGLAAIAGGTLGVPAVAFSPPGIVLSRYKFEDPFLHEDADWEGHAGKPKRAVRLSRVAVHSVNFIPSRDLVPKADLHFGLTQSTLCRASNPLFCHHIELMVCDLLKRCGDGHDGRRFHGCSFKAEKVSSLSKNLFG